MDDFTLQITLGNAAMQTGEDVAGALRQAADKIEGGKNAGVVRDLNGNTVGRFAGPEEMHGPTTEEDR